MENTIKVQAMPRTKDIITSNAKPARGQDMVSWWQSYRRGGVQLSTEHPTVVTIVEPPNKPFGQDNETGVQGAIDMVSDPRVKVWDSERTRDLMAKALEAHRKEENRHQKRMEFQHAQIVDEQAIPVVDDEIEGQGKVFEDGYEDMTKAQLFDAMLNTGFAEADAKRIAVQGKAAMIAALRGEN